MKIKSIILPLLIVAIAGCRDKPKAVSSHKYTYTYFIPVLTGGNIENNIRAEKKRLRAEIDDNWDYCQMYMNAAFMSLPNVEYAEKMERKSQWYYNKKVKAYDTLKIYFVDNYK